MKKLSILIYCGLCIIQSVVFAQTPVKYGKVSGLELRMESYEKDSTAAAVILCDVGRFNNRTYDFYRHLRVKILKKSGTKWGNWTFNVRSKSNISGIVYNLENGELVKEKLKMSSIHAEEITDDYYVYKVFMPNVRVGSVIDIKYSFGGLPYEWRFQDEIPVKYSELILEPSTYIDFSFNMFGFEPIQTVKPGEHWLARDVPAFKSEPYLTDYSNYLSKVELELRSVTIPGYYRDYTTTWDQVNQYLFENIYVGGSLKSMGFLNSFASSINELDLSVYEKIDTAYSYIQNNIKWNGVKTKYVTSGMRGRFVNDHIGNAAEVNLILVGLLKKLGVESHPVALSTRDHGILSPVTPSIQKMNYVIAYVRNGEEIILLDATDENLIPGVIPERCINGQGRLIAEGYSFWVDLKPKGQLSSKVIVNLEQDGATFHGKVNRRFNGYGYVRWNEDYENSESESNYTANLEQTYRGVVVSEYSYKKNKDQLKVDEIFEVDFSELVDDFGNEMHIPVSLLMQTENPFKTPGRKYPVDFIMPFSDQQIISIKLDENYKLASIPESIRLALPDGKGSFLFMCNQVGNHLQIQCKTTIKTPLFVETEYPILQQFYSTSLSKLSESIQLLKKT